jgi:hypothetical protein
VINCSTCGELLVQELTERSLTTAEGDTFPFRRTTDHVVCAHCGATKSVRTLRAEAVARGDLAPDDDEDEEPDPDEVIQSLLEQEETT